MKAVLTGIVAGLASAAIQHSSQTKNLKVKFYRILEMFRYPEELSRISD